MSHSLHIKNVKDTEFSKEINDSNGLKLVDFWAEWCGPCRALSPIVDELADHFAGKVGIYKMNVDDNPETPARLAIRGIPTLILFKDGKPVDRIVGTQSKAALQALLERHLQG